MLVADSCAALRCTPRRLENKGSYSIFVRESAPFICRRLQRTWLLQTSSSTCKL
ncbi:unnamed protein product, partial [Musa acuminata subsp. burmannicoides]